MKIIGLTGGMGAGKSLVANIFKDKGYPIYNSDDKAKELMTSDLKLKNQIIQLLGREAYIGNSLNKNFIAKKIFSNTELLKEQNAIVHLAVKNDFEAWVLKQKGKFCVKETAILFESGAYKGCDYIIAVTAPEKIRIERIKIRNGFTEEEIKKRLQNQWPQDKIVSLSDFHISNDSDIENLKNKVIEVIEKLNALLLH